MKRLWFKIAILLLLAAAGVVASLLLKDQVPSVHHVKQHKEQFLLLIETHYPQAVIAFISLYFATALFLPGALVLTVAGGMMFGTVPAAIYANLGATTGALVAFVAVRSMVGHAVQERFKTQLRRFNREMSNHGPNYLLMLRILPIGPFFVVNYCAAITKIPLKTFVWTTSIGMLPGSLIYAFMGEQLRHVEAPSDLLSGKIMLALALLALFVLAPVVLHHLSRIRK